jgi:hypothetical protein
MLTFHRASFTELWITIESDEPLSILDSAYVEDYFGVDGQLTIHNMDTDVRTSFLMAEDPLETPTIANDVFTGFVDITTLPDGIYQIEGRVRDTLGNYRILSDFQTPNGNEDITLFEIEITPLSVVVRIPKQADVFLVEKPSLGIALLEKAEADVVFSDSDFSIGLQLKEKGSTDIVLVVKPDSDLQLVQTPQLDITNVYTTI